HPAAPFGFCRKGWGGPRGVDTVAQTRGAGPGGGGRDALGRARREYTEKRSYHSRLRAHWRGDARSAWERHGRKLFGQDADSLVELVAKARALAEGGPDSGGQSRQVQDDGVEMQAVRVGVVMGGVSSEREISLKSGAAVTEALGQIGYEVVSIDLGSGSSALTTLAEAPID